MMNYPLWLLALALAAPVAAAFIDPRGPIENPGMKVVVSPDVIEARGYTFANRCQKPTPWQAEWVWLPAEAHVGAAACFRKEINLSEAPRRVSAWISADTKYRLWINGKLVSRGPVDIGRDYAGGSTGRWFYDARDLTPFFRKGVNVIAAEAFREWPIGFTVSRGYPGFFFEAEITQAAQSTTTVKSDNTWRGTPAAHFPTPTTYDASREPAGWRLAGFNDSRWQHCVSAGDHWTPLIPSEIPPLMEGRYPIQRIDQVTGGVTLRADGSLRATGNGSFRVVFDRVLSAYPTLRVKGGQGAVLAIRAQHGCDVILGEGKQCFEFPFMTEIAPAFTVTLSKVTTPVEISDVGANFTAQPVEYRGSFACSDERLNTIWKVSRWAVQICQQTHHLDSPNHQEPISDPGDYLIEAMVGHYAFQQPWLARQDIRKFAWLLKDEKYHNFHISYSLGWLQMLLDYYDYTGDRGLVDEMAPFVNELLDTYATWRGRNGIISEAPNYMFMDWVNIAGFGCHHPPAVIGQGYLTAFYYHGLAQGIRVAQMMGDEARAEKYARLRAEIAAAFERELWVRTKGLYRDGKPFQTSVKPHEWLPADTDIETFSPHVNLLAVLYDLAPRERQAAIVAKVMAEHPLNTQPWFMHWVFAAIDHAGLFDRYATPQMRRWSIVKETQSFREMWDGGDLSHGWCSTPLVQMSARVLGVTPASPGFKTIAVHPALCDLTWAKGSVPTPHGDVAVAWTLAKDRLELNVTVPPGAEANVQPPTARFVGAAVTVDGKHTSAPSSRVGAGRHAFVATGKLRPAEVEPDPMPAPPVTSVACDEYEKDVVHADLIHPGASFALVRYEDHCSHMGGGEDASALVNGTTRNGDGTGPTADDGRTFRGYGDGDWLTFYLDTAKSKAGYDLTKILTFAGHPDGRASQNYTVLVAFADDPTRFVPLRKGAAQSGGGSTKVILEAKGGGVLEDETGRRATGVVAVRFEFANGPLGFNVYREMNIVGSPTKTR